MSNVLKDKNDEIKVDLFLDGYNFIGGIIAYNALLSGFKVAIKINANLNTSYQPELSVFYPLNYSQIINSVKNNRFLLKCSSLFPHLFFPQRVLTFNSGSVINKQLNNTADKLLGRDRESASFPIKTLKYPEYSILTSSYLHGSLVYEYLFDRNRAITELYKKCHQNGAIIVNEDDQVSYKKRFICYQQDWEKYTLEIPDFFIPFKNSMRFEHPNFDITIQKGLTSSIFQFHFYNNESDWQTFKDKMYSLFQLLNIPNFESFIDQLKFIFESLTVESSNNEELIIDTQLNDLRTNFKSLIKIVSKQIGVKLSSDTIFKLHSNNEMNGANFRKIQNECDEKFDLAKQTGIDYHHFLRLFYRYRGEIDDMIENAYEKMNTERGGIKIWNQVEAEFLIKEIDFIK